MILIGQYDSPFVRRVAIALRLFGHEYEHRPWSVFRDGELIAPYNPLRRVPTLILDDETVLIESGAILDYLDEVAGPEKAMFPAKGEARRAALHVAALATGLADKAVILLYERLLHETASEDWMARCNRQMAGVLDALDKNRAARDTSYWFGDRIGHADIAVACAVRFMREAHPESFDPEKWPALAAHCKQCEALPTFQVVVQPLVVSR